MSIITYSIGILFILFFVIPGISFAPWVPTRTRDIHRALRLAKAKKGEILYDCGSGDGRVVLEATRLIGTKSIGIEISPLFFLISYIRKIISRDRNSIFYCRDLFKADLRNADIVFLFGREETLGGKLKNKLSAELKPGARVVSYVFPIEGWEAKAISKENPKEDLSIFLYVIG